MFSFSFKLITFLSIVTSASPSATIQCSDLFSWGYHCPYLGRQNWNQKFHAVRRNLAKWKQARQRNRYLCLLQLRDPEKWASTCYSSSRAAKTFKIRLKLSQIEENTFGQKTVSDPRYQSYQLHCRKTWFHNWVLLWRPRV